jgi:hypothetical protein
MTGGGIRASAVIRFSVPCGQVLDTFDAGKEALQQSIAARAGPGITLKQVTITRKCEPVPGQPAAASLSQRRLQTVDGSLLQVGGLQVPPAASHTWRRPQPHTTRGGSPASFGPCLCFADVVFLLLELVRWMR